VLELVRGRIDRVARRVGSIALLLIFFVLVYERFDLIFSL
jgi:hypothetical protein